MQDSKKSDDSISSLRESSIENLVTEPIPHPKTSLSELNINYSEFWRRFAVIMVFETQPRACYAEVKRWSALNAVTYLTDHHLGRTQEGRLASALYGHNKALNMKAVETAVEMSEVA